MWCHNSHQISWSTCILFPSRMLICKSQFFLTAQKYACKREAHFRENRGVQEYSRNFLSISMTWFNNCRCQIILQLMPLTHMLFKCIVYIFSTQCTDKKLFMIIKYKIEDLLAWVPWHPNQDTELRSSSVV